MTWFTEMLALVVGFTALGKGAHWLVDGGATLARRWGVEPLIVGLTVVAWGTSMPEVVVSVLAAAEGDPGMSLGNVLGSNVANIGLVLGASALILPPILLGRIALRELVWLLGSLALLWGVCYDRSVSRLDGVLLLAAFAFYNVVLFRGPRDVLVESEADVHVSRLPWVGVVTGSVAIAAGAQLVMVGARGLALRAGLSETVVGLTVLAVGTSLPELAAGVSSAMKGHTEIGFGNVIGSNVFNTLAVIGLVGLVAPFGEHPEMGPTLQVHFPLNLLFALALVVMPFFLRGKGGRRKAGVLLCAYWLYMLGVLVAEL